MTLPTSEIWFLTGSQHLYGPETLRQVAANAEAIVNGLNLSIPLVNKPTLTDPETIRQTCLAANADPTCSGVVIWMHTFSPAKMWIGGLTQLQKPLLHLHTQFHQDIPWQSIDMDFMNLNQSAHGDREAAHLHTRLNLKRTIVVGHWQNPETQKEIADWTRVARAWQDLQGAKFARFGDNMREVSVTDGDKVAAQIKFGFSVNGYGVGDLVKYINEIPDSEVDRLLQEYQDLYDILDPANPQIKRAAQQELGIKAFLEEGGFKGFTTTFEDLHGLDQLPGLACQRLMQQGYGFGAEGDWKTAALLRFMKVVAHDLEGGTSFMEDYTYHLEPGQERVLGAHMLEICPSIAQSKPKLEVHPLGIGGKADPARLVFDAPPGPALNASLIDLGSRFRLIVSEVEAVEVPPMPNLPVARALWRVEPNFKTGVTAWLLAGGAHHTAYSYAIKTGHLQTFAEIAGIELIAIDKNTKLEDIKKELRSNDQ